ncbi:MAG: hypothetical protein ACLQUY_15585 [Ktedonobacterales bacterium]
MEAGGSPAVTSRAADVEGFIWTIRLTAGMFALLQVLITISAAASAYPAVLTMQRSMVNWSENGGVSIGQLAGPLVQLFLVTYISALILLAITLGLAWYAGRVAMENTGMPAQAVSAGTSVALASGLVWLIIGIPLVMLSHADGTISWLIATIGVITVSPSGPPASSVYVTSPGVPYLLIEFLALLLQGILFLIFALNGGAIAGRIGAGSLRSRRAGA